jgi:hypothetical protein
MNPTVRFLIVLAGVACFAAAAVCELGWWLRDANPTGLALAGFAFWLASTAKLP